MKLAVMLAALFLVLGATTQQPPAPALSSLEGIVVRQRTNEPMADVELELSRVEGTSETPLAAGAAEMFSSILSDNSTTIRANGVTPPKVLVPELKYAHSGNDGKFIFKDLKEGKYRLAAAREGMYPIEFGQRDLSQRGIYFPVTAGKAITGMRLEMTPTGAISGRVVDEEGQPIGHAVVYALTKQFRAGRYAFYIETAALTDERGNYRLFWLRPRKYLVAATYEDPQRRTINLMTATPGRTMLRERATSRVVTRQTLLDGSVIEEAYGVVYHGGVLDPDKATLIEVLAGTTASGADIPMGVGKRRAYHIRGIVVSSETGQPVAGAQVLATPQQWRSLAVVLAGTSNAKGEFDLAGAVPEAYVITARGSGPPFSVAGRTIPGQPLVGYSTVATGPSDAEVSLVLEPGITLHGSVVIEGRSPENLDSALKNVKVLLTRDLDLISLPNPLLPPYPPAPPGARPTGPANGEVTSSGSFTLFASPGDFRVNVEGLPTTTYVKSIRMGREDIQSSGLHISKASNDVLEITLGIDGGTIGGSVVAGTAPFGSATIALLPEERTRMELYRTTRSDFNGAYQLTGIRPGNYKLFAWEWVPSDSWLNAEFIRAQENQGKTITIAPGKAENLQLIAIPKGKEAR